MKTHSSKVIKANDVKYNVQELKLNELEFGKESAQRIMDALYKRKNELKAEQDMQALGFRMDNNVKESSPEAKEEIRRYEERIQKEVDKKIALIEKKAYEDGFVKAKEEAYQAALAEVKAKAEPYVEEIKNMAQNFRKIREELVIKNERIIIDILTICVEKIIMGKYKKNTELLKSMIVGIVKMTGEREDIEIRLSPYDHERINHFTKELVEELGLKNGLRLEVDRGIEKGGCKVISNLGMINSTLEQEFEKMKKELRARVPRAKSSMVEERKIEDKEKNIEKEIKNEKIRPKTQAKSEEIADMVKNRIKKDE